MSEEYVENVERISIETKSTYEELNNNIKETESMLQEIENEEQVSSYIHLKHVVKT